MSFVRRVTVLGRQTLPKFANKATLVMSGQCFNIAIPFPEAEGIYNIACLGFFARNALLDDLVATFAQPMALSFWSKDSAVGINNIYGQDEVAIPQGAEYFSVSWLAPPVAMLDSAEAKPQPEDFFRVRFGLKL